MEIYDVLIISKDMNRNLFYIEVIKNKVVEIWRNKTSKAKAFIVS